MKKAILAAIVFLFPVLSFVPNYARAEVIQQDFTLKPGWNAVFLEVEPESSDPADVFSGVTDLLSVWMWNPRTSTVQYIQNPDMLVPKQPQWMVYFPNDPILTNLFAIHGETPYLIHLGGTTDVTWVVTGQPNIPHIDWKANSFNFVGFHLDKDNGPLFDDFFFASPAHNGQEIHMLDNATDAWVQVTEPTVRMRRGEAFWIYCKGSSEFLGPVSVQLEQGTGLHYGTTLVEQDLRVLNNSARNKTVSLSLSSLNNTIYYWVFDPANNVAGWTEFPSPLDLTIPIGETQKLRLGVKRAGLTADTLYKANMTVTDSEGMKILVPVSVTGISYSGLWVGNATITRVSEPANVIAPDTPVKTGSEFSFRLIVHADDSGTVRLLSQVIQMWQDGTWKPDPNNLGRLVVDEPGSFVLFTDDALIPSYSGAAMRDGQLVGRRISSPGFPRLTAAQGVMTGSAAPGGAFNPVVGNDLSMVVRLAQDNPTNPFRHMFHPDHKIPEQSYQVLRNVTLTFSDEDSEGRPITGVPTLNWQSSEIGGIYKETITGLHRNPLHIEGTFLLRKVNNVGTLTMQ